MPQIRLPQRQRNAAPGANVTSRQCQFLQSIKLFQSCACVAPANLFLSRAGAKTCLLASNKLNGETLLTFGCWMGPAPAGRSGTVSPRSSRCAVSDYRLVNSFSGICMGAALDDRVAFAFSRNRQEAPGNYCPSLKTASFFVETVFLEIVVQTLALCCLQRRLLLRCRCSVQNLAHFPIRHWLNIVIPVAYREEQFWFHHTDHLISHSPHLG